MKNTYITIIILVVLAAGVVFILGNSKKAEAPETEGDAAKITETSTVTEIAVGAVKEFTVSGKNFSFTPSTITVQKGDKVKITFENTAGFHDFVIDEYGVATKQTQSPTTEVLEFIADKVGSFEYYCSVGSHRAMGMKGVLKVE